MKRWTGLEGEHKKIYQTEVQAVTTRDNRHIQVNSHRFQAAQKYLKPFPYSTRYKLSSDYSAYTKPKKKNDGVCSTMYAAQGDLRQV